MKTQLIWHKLPELPEHSCTCACIMTYSDVFGVEYHPFSKKWQAFNCRDEFASDKNKVTSVIAWAEIPLSKELWEYANE